MNVEVRIPKKGDPKTNLDKALQRLKTKLTNEGIIDIVRAKRAFETPKEKRERKLRNRLKLIKSKKSFDNKKDL
ncbi:30S ribosomal protein S21 [bacterium]|nr:30S ribosomal protein S21 [bacterium]NBO36056.1 30S ribosomal protein S21 [bacterium]